MRTTFATTAASAVAALMLTVGPALAAPTAAQKCESAKNLAAGKYALCMHKAQKKFVQGGETDAVGRDLAELACGTKYLLKWHALEIKAGTGGCPSEGDALAIQGFVDACVLGTEEALGGGVLPLDVATCSAELAMVTADLATCSGDLSATNADLSATNADLTDCNADLAGCNADLAGCNADLAECLAALHTTFTFQSTVTAAFDAPLGVAEGDTVVFSVTMNLDDATSTWPNFYFCDSYYAIDCDVAGWTLAAPVSYLLVYSSGYTQSGQIDRIDMMDGGVYPGYMTPNADKIAFYDGYDTVWEAEDFDGTWQTGPIADDLYIATSSIDTPALFDLTFYFGSWSIWGTYHYDYTTPQVNTIVTRTP